MATSPPPSSSAIRDQHRRNFDELNRRVAGTAMDRHVRFFNFGYELLPGEQPVGPPLPRFFPKPDSAQLLLQLVGDAELTDDLVVEVGCGRAGNLWFLRRFCGVTKTVGIDLAFLALTFAARDGEPAGGSSAGGLAQGDAERLPLATACADVVLNVESGSAYPDLERFFREVHRVLRPGGLFLYADAVPVALVAPYQRVLRSLGFEVLDERDITANVAAARARRSERERVALGDDRGDPAGEWVGRPGSRIHDTLTDGSAQYRLWRMRRGAGTPPATRAFSAEERARQHEWARLSATLLTLDEGAAGPEHGSWRASRRAPRRSGRFLAEDG